MSEKDDVARVKQQHDELCTALTVDVFAACSSWDSYSSIAKDFMLEGEPRHWLACALYVACRSSVTRTVQGGAVEGNCVSLTKLLRLSNFSLIQFFTKIKKWMGMAAMPVEFTQRIERLERKFAVSAVLFRKYQPIFHELFVARSAEPAKTPGKHSKKNKFVPCTSNSLFEFTWCLFISVKGEFHSTAHDLVDMYHLLLACLDYVFANVYAARRTDLINPQFSGLPADWCSEEAEPAPCMVPVLCRSHVGLPLEAATTKQYSWRPAVASFFTKHILRGDKKTLTGILDIVNFEANLKSLNNVYETYVLSVGEFDERIFLGEHASDIGTSNDISGDQLTRTIATFGTSGRSHAPDTPLTGRRYLPAAAQPLTPVSAATHSVARLQAYLAGCRPQPSPQLHQLFAESGVEEEVVQSCVVEPCRRWSEQFLLSFKKETKSSDETAAARCSMLAALHYKILEHILREERRKKPQVHMKTLLPKEIFQAALFACCAEVVLHAYGAHSVRFPWALRTLGLDAFHFYKIIELVVQAVMDKLSRDIVKHLNTLLPKEIFQAALFACCAEVVLHAYGAHSVRFPWALRTLGLDAFHFYKIIELVVQAVMDKLSRDIVKHLNAVEESVLESLVWASESPIWELLEGGAAVPPASEVHAPRDPAASPATASPAASAAAQRRRALAAAAAGGGALLSPVSSVSERFLSPGADAAKKQLFKDPAPPACNIRPGQSLLVQGSGSVIMSNGSAASSGAEPSPSGSSAPSTSGAPAAAPSTSAAGAPSTAVAAGDTNPDARRNNRAGSLGLFYRKFYNLAAVRMNDLCQRLGLTDAELKKKIWTCLEHSVMHQTRLMRDRHLDQFLMCAVYVICKVSHNSTTRVGRTFTEIMRCYRQQPQADNHVYRSVLISTDTPTGVPERGDLILFYNKVYVQYMQTFAMRFTGRQREDCQLSPLPAAGRAGASPAGQRVSELHHLYVKPLLSPPPADNQLTYRFSRSPAKDLRAINTMLSCEVSVAGVKRAAEDAPASVKRVALGAPGVTRKLHGLITDRRAH